jgi:hypothetical protein
MFASGLVMLWEHPCLEGRGYRSLHLLHRRARGLSGSNARLFPWDDRALHSTHREGKGLPRSIDLHPPQPTLLTGNPASARLIIPPV